MGRRLQREERGNVVPGVGSPAAALPLQVRPTPPHSLLVPLNGASGDDKRVRLLGASQPYFSSMSMQLTGSVLVLLDFLRP